MLMCLLMSLYPCFSSGVLTKLDIMDRGTNALPALRNLVVPLRLGYVGIVNRSQADINSNKSMRDARRCDCVWTFFDSAVLQCLWFLQHLCYKQSYPGIIHVAKPAASILRFPGTYAGVIIICCFCCCCCCRFVPLCSAEQSWFESHSEYSEVAKQCGVGNLAKRINVILGK
jgi:hypothetical protein